MFPSVSARSIRGATQETEKEENKEKFIILVLVCFCQKGKLSLNVP